MLLGASKFPTQLCDEVLKLLPMGNPCLLAKHFISRPICLSHRSSFLDNAFLSISPSGPFPSLALLHTSGKKRGGMKCIMIETARRRLMILHRVYDGVKCSKEAVTTYSPNNNHFLSAEHFISKRSKRNLAVSPVLLSKKETFIQLEIEHTVKHKTRINSPVCNPHKKQLYRRRSTKSPRSRSKNSASAFENTGDHFKSPAGALKWKQELEKKNADEILTVMLTLMHRRWQPSRGRVELQEAGAAGASFHRGSWTIFLWYLWCRGLFWNFRDI